MTEAEVSDRMIFEINQMSTNFNMVWMAETGGKALATAVSPFEIGRFNIEIDYADEYKQQLCFNPKDGKSAEEKFSFKLYIAQQLAGTIVGRNQKVKGFLQSYFYRVMQIYGENYYLYEVGFGAKGLYLCIYKEDQLIAIVDKPLKVVNYRDKYIVYCLEEDNIKAIFPLVLQYDMTEHGDIAEVSLRSVKVKRVNTIQKELIAKYDPNFIPMIKQRDGVVE